MSNAPDDKRPQSDVADQLAGTPVDDTQVQAPSDAAADAPAGTDTPAPAGTPGDDAVADQLAGTPSAQPEPLVEPQSTPLVEPRTDSSSQPTEAAEAAPLPAGVQAPHADEARTDASRPPADAAPAHVVADPVVPAQPQTVYVTAPTPPKKRGNRGLGTLFAVLGTLAFALLHGMITAIAYVSADRSFDLSRFLVSSGFLVPTLTFLVVFVLAVLLINRAGWWAWVLGSLVVAVATYLASIGIVMLLENVVAMTPAEAEDTWQRLAVSAPMVIALVVAREVAIWFGLAIAVRGRRVKARNIEARAAYDRELAEHRARYATNAG